MAVFLATCLFLLGAGLPICQASPAALPDIIPSYELDISLDADARFISGTNTFCFCNHSPNTHRCLYLLGLRCYLNLFGVFLGVWRLDFAKEIGGQTVDDNPMFYVGAGPCF